MNIETLNYDLFWFVSFNRLNWIFFTKRLNDVFHLNARIPNFEWEWDDDRPKLNFYRDYYWSNDSTEVREDKCQRCDVNPSTNCYYSLHTGL